eukprot:2378412-Rhodomonas_salina.1
MPSGWSASKPCRRLQMRSAIVVVPREARRVVRTTMVVSLRVRGSDRSRVRVATRRSRGKGLM